MFKEYILSKSKEKLKQTLKESEVPLDPCTILRYYGIKIKYSKPHKEGFEIALYTDPEKLNLKEILKGFDFKIKDSKIFVCYTR